MAVRTRGIRLSNGCLQLLVTRLGGAVVIAGADGWAIGWFSSTERRIVRTSTGSAMGRREFRQIAALRAARRGGANKRRASSAVAIGDMRTRIVLTEAKRRAEQCEAKLGQRSRMRGPILATAMCGCWPSER